MTALRPRSSATHERIAGPGDVLGAETGFFQALGANIRTGFRDFATLIPQGAEGLPPGRPPSQAFAYARITGMRPEEYLAAWWEDGTLIINEDQHHEIVGDRPIPFERGVMTRARSQALVATYDAAERDAWISEHGPSGMAGVGTQFFGMLIGAAADPANYIPVLGPVTLARAIARFGQVGGRAATTGAEAMAISAVTMPIVYNRLTARGEDFGIEDAAVYLGLSAAAGAAFGAGAGTIGRITDRRAAARATASAELQLEALGRFSVAVDDMINLRPMNVPPVTSRMAAEIVESVRLRDRLMGETSIDLVERFRRGRSTFEAPTGEITVRDLRLLEEAIRAPVVHDSGALREFGRRATALREATRLEARDGFTRQVERLGTGRYIITEPVPGVRPLRDRDGRLLTAPTEAAARRLARDRSAQIIETPDGFVPVRGLSPDDVARLRQVPRMARFEPVLRPQPDAELPGLRGRDFNRMRRDQLSARNVPSGGLRMPRGLHRRARAGAADQAPTSPPPAVRGPADHPLASAAAQEVRVPPTVPGDQPSVLRQQAQEFGVDPKTGDFDEMDLIQTIRGLDEQARATRADQAPILTDAERAMLRTADEEWAKVQNIEEVYARALGCLTTRGS